MSEAELEEKMVYLKEEHNIGLEVTNIKRNSDGKISAISLTYYTKNGSSGRYSSNNDGKPIDDIVLSFDEDGGMSAGNTYSGERAQARKAQMVARKLAREGEMKARRLAREGEMKARRAEMALRKAELEAKKAEMAAMSDEQKAEMKAQMDALKAELAEAKSEEKAEMKAQIAELKMRQKEMAAKAKSIQARGYARAASAGAATIAGDVVITKNTTDAELEQIKRELAAEGVDFSYKRVKRNASGEITGIRISLDNNQGSKSSTQVSGQDDGIENIYLEY